MDPEAYATSVCGHSAIDIGESRFPLENTFGKE
jgi:hypothetical protein